MSTEINGYVMDGEFTTQKSSFSRWGFANKNGKNYFIKEFLKPVYPLNNTVMTESQIKVKITECEKFELNKKKLYDTLGLCRTGNIVIISDFFLNKSRYYIVTEKIDVSPMPLDEVCKLDLEKLMLLTRVVLYNVDILHRNRIIHADIKPDNFLLKLTSQNFLTVKIIDFDSSFLADDTVPDGDSIDCDQVYCAPETYRKIIGEDVVLSTEIDIFALGIILCQYWSGELPAIPGEYDYLFEAVLNGVEPSLSPDIPEKITSMIKKMLRADPKERPSAHELLNMLDGKYTEPDMVVPPVSVNITDAGTKLKIRMNKRKPEISTDTEVEMVYKEDDFFSTPDNFDV